MKRFKTDSDFGEFHFYLENITGYENLKGFITMLKYVIVQLTFV